MALKLKDWGVISRTVFNESVWQIRHLVWVVTNIVIYLDDLCLVPTCFTLFLNTRKIRWKKDFVVKALLWHLSQICIKNWFLCCEKIRHQTNINIYQYNFRLRDNFSNITFSAQKFGVIDVKVSSKSESQNDVGWGGHNGARCLGHLCGGPLLRSHPGSRNLGKFLKIY